MRQAWTVLKKAYRAGQRRPQYFEMTQEERDKAGIEKLPENLYEAIQCMQEDKVICDVLGEHIVSKYVEAKLKEWNDYRTRVSQWELDEYLYKF